LPMIEQAEIHAAYRHPPDRLEPNADHRHGSRRGGESSGCGRTGCSWHTNHGSRVGVPGATDPA
jgi:hypothetical protein